ncbi:MAG: hypothetical protein ACP5NV_02315 [Candidatus Woesearchaeota archaeon]
MATVYDITRKLTIDDSYLKNLNKEKNWVEKLKSDLDSVVNGGMVYLERPTTNSLVSFYTDVRSHVASNSILGNYKIKVSNDYEATMIKSILGANNVEGDLKSGYSFKKAV